MLPGMATKPRIVIVGAGNFGTALAVSLRRAGYAIELVIARRRGASLRKARTLARQVGATASAGLPAEVRAEVIWFCVPDGQIALAARDLASKIEWDGKIALHSSGALASDELDALRRRGAAVASVHPMMTFVRGSQIPRNQISRTRPSLAGVPFAVEGDAAAVRAARRIVNDLGGNAHAIRKQDKAAYHAWGAFASPLFTALLATSERVAASAGVKRKEARRQVIPILLQTLANYASFGAPGAFSGPIVRGDVDTVKKHMRVLAKVPPARDVYMALARAALRYLPAKRRTELARALRG
ncbi:MAG: Rossmann-like and DUF2520 domain-containing protein [Candidatus Sulfotelmatobacter sp.]